jgi:hypothetical protein
MIRGQSRIRRTDYGTVILHGLLVAALVITFLTGLRIASETPDRTWINAFDFVLPSRFVWTAHMQAAVALVAVAIAYVVYVTRAGLTRRIRFDRVRVAGLFGRPDARWGAVNIALYWVFFAACLTQIATGAMLYFDWVGKSAADLHWLCTWIIVAYAFAHPLAQWRLGQESQLLRIVRPAGLVPPPPPFDPLDLLDLLNQPPPLAAEPPAAADGDRLSAAVASDSHRLAGAAPAPHVERRARRNPSIQSNPFVVALSAAVVGASAIMVVEHQSGEDLRIRRVERTAAPVIDGDTSDPVWQATKPIRIVTGHGGNFEGRGETTIEARVVHDGEFAYFLFAWDDPTRSLKHLPLRKTPNGWKLLHDGYESADERAYHEDKFAVLLTTLDVTLAGDRTFHAGPMPAAGMPPTLSGRGLHYTGSPGLFVDVWQWKATSSGETGFMDDNHFGPPAEPTPMQADGSLPYRGGFAPDSGTAAYADNFTALPASGNGQVVSGHVVLPRRLPRDIGATMAALGQSNLDPNRGESDGARWYLTEGDSAPYSRDLDDTIAVGTIVPGVVITGIPTGDQADIRCAARWAAGRWALEVVRRLDTGSPYDVAIASGVFMRVAAFDRSQIRHTRHVRPIRLEVE